MLSGYQEVITDPSYAGQVIAFTYPHIGNYGVNPADDEAARPHCRGVIVRRPDRPAQQLAVDRVPRGVPDPTSGVPGITGIDTRRLTRHLRDHGSDAVCLRHRRRPPSCWPRPRRRRPPRAGTWWPP